MVCDSTRRRSDQKTNFWLHINRKVNNLAVTLTNWKTSCSFAAAWHQWNYCNLISRCSYKPVLLPFTISTFQSYISSFAFGLRAIFNSVLSGRYYCQFNKVTYDSYSTMMFFWVLETVFWWCISHFSQCVKWNFVKPCRPSKCFALSLDECLK